MAGRPPRRHLAVRVLRRLAGLIGRRFPPVRLRSGANVYEALYDAHCARFSDEDVVGGADTFDVIGRIELALLLQEGLRPDDTLVDFGCGTGRLAVHVVPYLTGGRYIGIDVSRPMLEKAEQRLRRVVPRPPCRVSWIQQTRPVFPLDDASADMVCAFSVFTHLEHEDSYRYLADARRIVRPAGRFVFSCLPLSLPVARRIFLREAHDDFHGRWSRVRNVATTVELMEAIARLAGWQPVRWYAGDRANIRMPHSGELTALGQSTCVLAPAASLVEEPATLAPGEQGRIVLRWTDPRVALAPWLDGPLSAAPGAFRLAPGPGAEPIGSLDGPPFAQARVESGERRATVSVSRLVPGTYRYSVVLASVETGATEPDALLRSGATVTLYHDSLPAPAEFQPPPGWGRRWNVFEVAVGTRGPHLRVEDTLDDPA